MRRILSRVSTTYWQLFYKSQRFSYYSAGYGPFDGEFFLSNYQVKSIRLFELFSIRFSSSRDLSLSFVELTKSR